MSETTTIEQPTTEAANEEEVLAADNESLAVEQLADDLSPVLSAIEHEHYCELLELERVADELECEYEDAKHVAAMKKKRFERAVEELRNVARRGPSRQRNLPGMDTPQETKEHDELMATPIFDVLTDLTDKQIEKFGLLGIKTVSDFEKLRAGSFEECPRGLIDVKGWGEAMVTKMENAVLDWLAANQTTEPSDEEEVSDVEYEDAE